MSKKEDTIIALLLIIIVGIAILSFFSFRKEKLESFEKVVYPKGATCEEMIDYFAKEKALDIRQPICTHYYKADEKTGKEVLTRCMCNMIYCEYNLFGRIESIKECETKQVEINVTLIK